MADPVKLKSRSAKGKPFRHGLGLTSDVYDRLNAVRDRMEAELHFRPTMPQTLLLLIANFEKERVK